MATPDMAGDMAGEPSMDEILASIRKIIAEEPAGTRSDISLPPRRPEPPLLPKLDDRRRPAFQSAEPAVAGHGTGRLADALTERARPAADDDLSDLVDTPAQARAAPENFGPLRIPAPAPVLDRVPLPPLFGETPRPAATQAPDRVRSVDLGQLRPSRDTGMGFTMPLTPAPLPDAASSAAAPAPIQAVPAQPLFEPAHTVSKPETRRADIAPATPQSAATAEGVLSALMAGLAAASTGRPATPAPVAGETTSAHAEPEAATVSGESPAAAAAAEPSVESPTAPANSASSPAASIESDAQPTAVVVAFEAAADATDTAAAQSPSADSGSIEAVEDAATAVAVDADTVTPDQPAIVTVEPVEPAVPVAVPVPTAAALDPAPAAPRTMEDTVAEMLRPMLAQWLDSNMPRIVEKALAGELAERKKSA